MARHDLPSDRPVGRPTKFRPDYYVVAYRMARSGAPNKSIADAIGVDETVFRDWRGKFPALDRALQQGRQESGVQGFLEYCRHNLDPELRSVWDRIVDLDKLPDGAEKVRVLVESQGKKARQHLFVHALVASNFHVGEACRITHVSHRLFRHWCENDHDFAQVVEEIHWHKGNFFEGALCSLVAHGQSSAVLHANKTYNKNRGYGDASSLPRDEDRKNFIPLDRLSLELRRQVLEELRQQQSRGRLPPKVVAGEEVVIEAV